MKRWYHSDEILESWYKKCSTIRRRCSPLRKNSSNLKIWRHSSRISIITSNESIRRAARSSKNSKIMQTEAWTTASSTKELRKKYKLFSKDTKRTSIGWSLSWSRWSKTLQETRLRLKGGRTKIYSRTQGQGRPFKKVPKRAKEPHIRSSQSIKTSRSTKNSKNPEALSP